MAGTEFPLNHPLAVQVWSNSLAVESGKRQYFSKFMGTGESALIVVKTELQKQAGEKITVGLRMKLREDGVEGDNLIEGTSAEEALTFFSDSLFIDQKRKGTKSKGKMSEQRVPYNLRKEGRDALATWWSEYYDEQFMMYLSGARGINADFISPLSFKGRANNPLQAPDAEHMVYGGSATGKADLTANDKMSLARPAHAHVPGIQPAHVRLPERLAGHPEGGGRPWGRQPRLQERARRVCRRHPAQAPQRDPLQ